MEINWLGRSCFRIKGKQATIITDPFSIETGLNFSRMTADIISLSHIKPEEAGLEKIGGEPYIVHGPGEYEVRNVLIIGLACYQDEARGSLRGKNTAYVFDTEELSICHLGSLGHMLTDAQIETIGNVDILFVPAGGNVTMTAAQASRLIRTIEPKIVIPMLYKTQATGLEFEPIDKFLNETGAQNINSQPKLNITKNSLPISTQVVLLDSPC